MSKAKSKIDALAAYASKATKRGSTKCSIGASPHRDDYERAWNEWQWSYKSITGFAEEIHGERITTSMISAHLKSRSCSCFNGCKR